MGRIFTVQCETVCKHSLKNWCLHLEVQRGENFPRNSGSIVGPVDFCIGNVEGCYLIGLK